MDNKIPDTPRLFFGAGYHPKLMTRCMEQSPSQIKIPDCTAHAFRKSFENVQWDVIHGASSSCVCSCNHKCKQ